MKLIEIEELCNLYLRKEDKNKTQQKIKEAKIQGLLAFVQDPVAREYFWKLQWNGKNLSKIL